MNRYCLGRVMSGTLKKGQTVRVLGEAYSPDDEVGPCTSYEFSLDP